MPSPINRRICRKTRALTSMTPTSSPTFSLCPGRVSVFHNHRFGQTLWDVSVQVVLNPLGLPVWPTFPVVKLGIFDGTYGDKGCININIYTYTIHPNYSQFKSHLRGHIINCILYIICVYIFRAPSLACLLYSRESNHRGRLRERNYVVHNPYPPESNVACWKKKHV